jgi:AcrR family transcriptional regulator
LVNYHFGSKDALIAAAAERLFAEFGPRWERIAAAARSACEATERADRPTDADGFERAAQAFAAGKAELAALLKDVAQTVELAAAGSEFAIRRELVEGDLATTRLLASSLRSFLPRGTDERELRWAAFFIVAPLQLIFLRRDILTEWTGTNVADRAERDAVIDFVVDRILEPFAASSGTGSAQAH